MIEIPRWIRGAILLAASAMLIRAIVDGLRLIQALRIHGF